MLQQRIMAGHRIMLQSGTTFDLSNPCPDSITIEDIAHGLSNICRYAGQCRRFYSVAEHSVLVSRVVPHECLAGLLHDSAEAFVGDVSSPLKALVPDYRRIEKAVEFAVFQKFGLNWPPSPEIKMADYSVMAREQLELMPNGTNSWLYKMQIKPAEVAVQALSPRKAKKLFLDRFTELTSVSSKEFNAESNCFAPSVAFTST